MKINYELNDEEFPENEIETVKKNLRINDEELKEAFKKIAKTAFLEYKQMFLERGLPSKADEVLQERLSYLIKYYYVDRLPNESEIQTIFQLTASKSKTLLKNTRSKFRTSLQNQIDNSVKTVLQSAKKSKEKWQLVIQSSNVLEEINEIVSKEGPTLQKLNAVRGSASLYECPESTLELVKGHYK